LARDRGIRVLDPRDGLRPRRDARGERGAHRGHHDEEPAEPAAQPRRPRPGAGAAAPGRRRGDAGPLLDLRHRLPDDRSRRRAHRYEGLADRDPARLRRHPGRQGRARPEARARGVPEAPGARGRHQGRARQLRAHDGPPQTPRLPRPRGGGVTAVRILHLYPRELGINGDAGNVATLVRRLEWRGLAAEVLPRGMGERMPNEVDLVHIGTGQAAAQRAVHPDLLTIAGRLRDLATDGVPMVAITAGWQLFGRELELADGTVLE